MKYFFVLLLLYLCCSCRGRFHLTRVTTRTIVTVHESYTNNFQLEYQTNICVDIEQNDGQGWHFVDKSNVFYNSETLFRTNHYTH